MHPILISYFRLIKRLLPADTQRSVVGIDLGGGMCKVVEISRRLDHFELLRWKIEPIENLDEKLVLGRIASSWDLIAKPRPIYCSVFGRGTLIRYIDMPRMSLPDLKKSFAIETDKYFPFPKDTVYTDCVILNPSDNDKKMTVLVAAVKKELIDTRLKLFKDCGIEVSAITLSSIALANALALFPADVVSDLTGKGDRVSAVVDIGEQASNLMIIEGKFPRFNRDIFIGTHEMCRRLSNVLGVSPSESRQLIFTPGEKLEQVQREVEAIMANLVAEIRLSFDYFMTEKNLQISQLIIVGEGAPLPGVEKAFKESFDIPIVQWNPCEKITLTADLNKAELERQSPRLLTACGLAFNEYD